MSDLKTLLNADKLRSIFRLMDEVAGVPGYMAECGVYHGGTLAAMAERHPERRFYGFDTFTGLPGEMWSKDEHHKPGEFGDHEGYKSIDDRMPDNVVLVRGVFPESAHKGLALSTKFALVHLDFDFYASTLAAIDYFQPRMAPGGAIVFDDFEWPHCPGVKQAIDERNLKVEVPVANQAVYRA